MMINTSIFRPTREAISILFCNCYISPVQSIMLLTGGGNMLGISPAIASACQQGWHLLVKTSVASPKERMRREELRERERAWLENEMRRETMVQDWRKALDQRWGETVRFFLTFVYFNYRNQMTLLEPSQLDSNQVGPVPSQRPKIFLLEDWPQLQTYRSWEISSQGCYRTWGVIQIYKLQNRQEEGQLNSRHQSQSGPIRLDCGCLPLIRRNIGIGISEGMVVPPPNYETPWSQRLSWSRLLFVAINNVKQNRWLCVFCM